jgi:hypothetical protein
MKKLLLPLVWIPFAIISLVVCLHVYAGFDDVYEVTTTSNSSKATTALPYYGSVPKVLGEQAPNAFYIQSQDIMPRLIELYLRKNKSPMLDSYQDLILTAQKHGIDPIFMVSIAQCESNLGKKMPHKDAADPTSCHNPFGWGIHSKGTLCFDTWQQGYEAVASGLRSKYFNKGYENPEDIMKKYTPPALEKQGSWAKCVNHFIDDLHDLRDEM